MKLQSAIKKIEKRLEGTDYQMTIEPSGKKGICGEIVLLTQGRVITMSIGHKWDCDKTPEKLKSYQRKATKAEFMKYGHENPGGALKAKKWLLAGTCSKRNDLQGAWVGDTMCGSGEYVYADKVIVFGRVDWTQVFKYAFTL